VLVAVVKAHRGGDDALVAVVRAHRGGDDALDGTTARRSLSLVQSSRPSEEETMRRAWCSRQGSQGRRRCDGLVLGLVSLSPSREGQLISDRIRAD
jgi:hypothetical protein